jgi:hypothetical protein
LYFKSYIKQLKLEYNKPQILNRFNNEPINWNEKASYKKTKYHILYSQYEKNGDFWSFDYLTTELQIRILKVLVTYWWPNFLIRNQYFYEYVKQKYPFYSTQRDLCGHETIGTNVKKSIFKSENSFINNKSNDCNAAENIQRSLNYFADENSRNLVTPFKEKEVLTKTTPKKTPKIQNKNSNNSINNKVKTIKFSGDNEIDNFRRQQTISDLDRSQLKTPLGYESSVHPFDKYKTSPPVGWKRPKSSASIFVETIIKDNLKTNTNIKNDNKQNLIQQQNKNRLDKEVYFEAVCHDNSAGQIFMKFLISKDKTVIQRVYSILI